MDGLTDQDGQQRHVVDSLPKRGGLISASSYTFSIQFRLKTNLTPFTRCGLTWEKEISFASKIIRSFHGKWNKEMRNEIAHQ